MQEATPWSGESGIHKAAEPEGFSRHSAIHPVTSGRLPITQPDEALGRGNPQETDAPQPFVPNQWDELGSNDHAPLLINTEHLNGSVVPEQLPENNTHAFTLPNTTDSQLLLSSNESSATSRGVPGQEPTFAGNQLFNSPTSSISVSSDAASDLVEPLAREKDQLLQSSYITEADNTSRTSFEEGVLLDSKNLTKEDYTPTATVDYHRQLASDDSMGNKYPLLQLVNTSDSPQHHATSGYIYYKVLDDPLLDGSYDVDRIQHLCNGTAPGVPGTLLSIVPLDHSENGYLYNVTDHLINCTNYSNGLPEESDLEYKSPALGVLLAVFAMITICGNILVMIAVARERYLRTVTNYFIVSLAIADLIIGKYFLHLLVKKQLDLWVLWSSKCAKTHCRQLFSATPQENRL